MTSTPRTGDRAPRTAPDPSWEALDPLMFGEEQGCFGCGPNNAVGLRLRFYRDGEDVVTFYHPAPGYEGPPGILHGGLQATLADEIGAWTVIAQRGKFGFTTSMNLRLLRPARYGTPIECRGRIAGETDSVLTIKTTLQQAGKTLVTGKISYAVADRAKAEELLGITLPDDWARFSNPTEE